MNLKEFLLEESSKAQCDKVVKWVGSDQKHFDELFDLFLHAEHRVVQRAAWPVSYCVIANPELINKHWTKMIRNLQKPGIHDAVKRNSMRLLQEIDIPKKYQGDIMNICFEYVASQQEAIAVKAFALTVLANLAELYPEIIPELKVLIEEQLPYQSPAFKNRANKLLKKFAKL